MIKINSLYGVQTSSNRSRLWFSEILKTFLLWTAWFDWSLWYQFSVKSKHSRKWTQKKLGHFVSSWLPFHFSEMKGYGGAGKAKAATPAASGLFPSLTFLVTSAWHRSPLILSFSSFVSNDMVQLICEPRKDEASARCFAWTRTNVKMRFHLFPLFFVTTADAAVWNNFLRFFTRLKNQIHGITGVQNPHLSLGRVQFQHRLKCIVEIGQDFIDILQKKSSKSQMS